MHIFVTGVKGAKKNIKGILIPKEDMMKDRSWMKEKMPFTVKQRGNMFTKNKTSHYFYD